MPTGADSYIRYKREAGTYTSHFISGDATWKVFGHNQRVDTTFRNANTKLYGLGDRQVQKVTPLAFGGSATVNFTMGNPWFLRLLTGQPAQDRKGSGSTSGIHYYYFLDTASEASGADIIVVSGHITSLYTSGTAFTIENGINLGTDSVRSLQGCVVERASITAAQGGVVEVSLTCPFRTITKGTTGYSVPTADTFDLYTFAHGSLKLPTGTTLAHVQNVSLEIAGNPELLYGLGSRFISYQQGKQLDVTIKAAMLFLTDSDIFDYFLGSTTAATTPTETTLDLVFDNGKTGVDQQVITFKFTGAFLDEYTLNQAVENPLIEEWTPTITKWTLCKAQNSTTAEP